MWLITPRGFYSAVQKPWDGRDGMLTIRARAKVDLENLKDLLPDAKPFQEGGYSDYPWRIRVSQADWAEAIKKMALEIDYSNFKDEVTKRQGKKRHDIYTRVWSVLLSLEARRHRQAGTRLFSSTSNYDYGDDIVGPIDEPLDGLMDEPYEEGGGVGLLDRDDPRFDELPPMDQPRLPGLRTRPPQEGDDE